MQPLPPRVRVKNGAYHYDLGRDEHGRRRWKKLCRISDGEAALYRELANVTTPRAGTLNAVFDAFLGSTAYRELASRTQKDYMSYINGNLRTVFGETAPDQVHSGHIAQYLQHRLDSGAGKLANKEIACLSSVYNFGMRHEQFNIQANPCKGVRRNKRSDRDRYIENDEFLKAFDAAPEAFQDFLAGLYLTGLRQGDLRRLRRSQITPDGLRVQQGKTGRVVIIAMSEALRYFIIRSQTRAPSSPYVFTNTQGEPWGEWAIQSQVRRLRGRIGRYDWTLHDVRAKAESDHTEGLGLLPLYRRARRLKPVR